MPALCQDGAPSTQRGERWFPDSSGASLAKFTHAAEALATQAAGLFSKSDTSERALSGTKPDVEASPAAPDEPPVQPAVATDDSKETWLETGRSSALCCILQARFMSVQAVFLTWELEFRMSSACMDSRCFLHTKLLDSCYFLLVSASTLLNA